MSSSSMSKLKSAPVYEDIAQIFNTNGLNLTSNFLINVVYMNTCFVSLDVIISFLSVVIKCSQSSISGLCSIYIYHFLHDNTYLL